MLPTAVCNVNSAAYFELQARRTPITWQDLAGRSASGIAIRTSGYCSLPVAVLNAGGTGDGSEPADVTTATSNSWPSSAGRQAPWLDERHQDLIHDLGEQLMGRR
jgi:hypothetical protein